MTSLSVLLYVAAWCWVGVDAFHSDTCDLQATIRCQVPTNNWSDCNSILHHPHHCQNIPVSFKLKLCTTKGSDDVTLTTLTTHINDTSKNHEDAKGVTIPENSCKWRRMTAVFNTCQSITNTASMSVEASSDSGFVCKDYVEWEMTAVTPLTLPPVNSLTVAPTMAPTFGTCPLEATISCNLLGPGWPNCNTLSQQPILCNTIPISMRYKVCNTHHSPIQLTHGKRNVNGNKLPLPRKLRKALLNPGQCTMQRKKEYFDTCNNDSLWSWMRVLGTSDGQDCKGYEFMKVSVETYTLVPTSDPTVAPSGVPTVAPTPEPCQLEASVSCQVIDSNTWSSCTTLLRDPHTCTIPVSLKFTVCNLQDTGNTSLQSVESSINGQSTVLDVISEGDVLDAKECKVQRRRVVLDTCNHDHFWAWISVVGDAGCMDDAIWSHTMTEHAVAHPDEVSAPTMRPTRKQDTKVPVIGLPPTARPTRKAETKVPLQS